MPTLAALGVHPRLVEKLASLEPSVETPLALLSRDPKGLAQALKVPLVLIEQVRYAVADALIVKTDSGRCALHIQSKLSTKPFIQGSLSAYDLLRYKQKDSMNVTPSIPLPECDALNRLLAFPRNTRLSCFNSLTAEPTRDDTVTDGGLPFGYITQITGPPATGKTQLALHLSSIWAEQEQPVHYLCSAYGHGTVFPLARRLKQFCTRENFMPILRNVNMAPIQGALALLTQLKTLEQDIMMVMEKETKPALVIVDSIAGCLASDVYSGKQMELIQEVIFCLKRLAHNYPVAVLVTNSTVSNKRPALGQILSSVADIHVWFDQIVVHQDGSKRIQARLEKHPAKPYHCNPKETCEFQLCLEGIVDLQR